MKTSCRRAHALRHPLLLATAAAVTLHTQLAADTFGSGANQFDIDFVPIGNPGNPADTTGGPNPAGSVPYGYRMGTYEVMTPLPTYITPSPLGWVGWKTSRVRAVPKARPGITSSVRTKARSCASSAVNHKVGSSGCPRR
jgi:hypothetical protein